MSWRRRWSQLDVAMRDALLALVLTAAVQAELVLSADRVEGSVVLQHLAFTVMTGAVALRRKVPLAAPVLAGAGLAGQTLIGPAPVATGYVALFVIVYSVATYAPSRGQAVLGLLALLAGSAVYPFTVDDVNVADEVVNAMIPTVVWALARVARERLDRAVLAERVRLQQAGEAERLADQALAAERRRIGRELHDTVAHGVTLMLLQTEVLRDRPGDQAALDVVQAAGRSCFNDLRRLLNVLRDDVDPERAGRGVSQLPDVVDAARAAGARIELLQPGGDVDLPRHVDLAVFRVAQEGITNALRYASGAEIRVAWTRSPDHVQIVVEDDGARGLVPPQTGSGLGLVGVRERIGVCGGHVSAGPRADGQGWRLEATVPLRVPVPQ